MTTLNNNTIFQPEADDVSIKEIVSPLWNRRWLILFFTLFITLICAVYVSSLKPSFIATAVLQIGNNKPNQALSINDAFDESKASTEQIQTQYELLRSRKFAERVIAQLDLRNDRDFISGKYKDNYRKFFNKPKITTISIEGAVATFQARLNVTPITNTELVKISFYSYSPELSAKVANYIGATYLQYQDELHSMSQETTSQWLVDQLEELGKKLEASEQALQTFREEKQIVDIKGVVGLISNELNELMSEALIADKRVDELAITVKYIKENKNEIRQLVEISEINENIIYSKLREQEERLDRKFSEISKRYGPKHPKRIAVEAEFKSITDSITKQVKDIVFSIEKEYLEAIARLNATQERLSKAKQDFLRLSRLDNKFSQLLREVETNKELYSTYLIRLKEADAMGNYRADFYVRFIDKALPPKGPFKPNKTLLTLLAMVISMVFISAVIIMRELMLDTLNSRRKLDSFTEANILAVLPRIKRGRADDKDQAVDRRFVEAVRTLRTSLIFSQKKKPPKIIAVTSSEPGEGKSTVALELARSFSEMEKVLLIEGDLRHPTIAKNLGLDPNRPGLSNLLAKTHQIDECIVRDEHKRLDMLTSGITPSNPLAFLSMKRFNMLIKVFGNFYDRIIIETPPVNAVSDAVIISKLVDSVIYIVHGGKTRREQILSGLRLLKQVNAPIEGVVINHSENIDTTKYQNKYYNDMANIIKLPTRKQG